MSQLLHHRLTIAHLFLWMLGAGTVLGLSRGITSSEFVPAWRHAFDVLWLIGQSASVGAALAFAALQFWRLLRRTKQSPWDPGYWLLAALATQAIANFAVERGIAAAENWLNEGVHGLHGPDLWVFLTLKAVPAIATALCFVRALQIGVAFTALWRVSILAALFAQTSTLIGCLAMVSIGYSGSSMDAQASEWFRFHEHWTSVGVAALIVVAGIADPNTRRRDWLHWVGITAWAVFNSLEFASAFVWRLSF